MKIKDVEKQVGISKANIRFYEEEGLIHPARNQENNCQQHNRDHGTTMPIVSAEIASNQTAHDICAVIKHIKNYIVSHCRKKYH